jgi:phage terminase large subunit
MNVKLPYNWVPRNYQMPAWQYFIRKQEGLRGAAIWHRRAGKDLFGINLIACKMAQRTGMYWHVLPTYQQGKKIVWNGATRTGRRFLDHFPKELVKKKNGTEMLLELHTGSFYQVVGSDNVDSIVGTNPVGVVFSEYSLQDPRAYDYIRPILAENGGWAFFNYTARGRNHGYRLSEMARKNPKWFHEILVAGNNGTKKRDGTPVIPDEIIDEERKAGMPEETVQSEFYCSFDAPVVGAYYGKQLMIAEEEGRIRNLPYDPYLPVNTYWDLGIDEDDAMAIWFIQQYRSEVRAIDYYEMSGEGLPHYAKILKEKDYIYGEHWAPPDINVREIGTGRSRKDMARDLGIKFKVVRRHEVVDGIENVRGILSRCYFDEKKCERGLDALRQYRKEALEEKKQRGVDLVVTYKSTPVHDWTSHGADAFRMLAMSIKKQDRPIDLSKYQQSVDSYEYV